MSQSVDFSAQFGQNSGFVSELFELYKKDAGLVSETWANYFRSFEIDGNGVLQSSSALETKTETNGHSQPRSNGQKENGHHAAELPSIQNEKQLSGDQRLQEKVYKLISAYRSNGHLKAKINPLSKGIFPLPQSEDIDLNYYAFKDEDLNKEVSWGGFKNRTQGKLSELISSLSEVFCGSIGFEYTHLLSEEERNWLQSRIENRFSSGQEPSKEQKLHWLKVLVEAEAFESELHKKYVGHKRFSLEGGETLIPLLDTLLEEGVARGVKEAIIGMAHRGRLNVLVHTVGKPLEDVFNEFEDQSIYSALGSGDVKYHLGYTSTFTGGKGDSAKVSLACNPSHLEFVDPVVVGMARARQDLVFAGQRSVVMPIVIHGDAAVVGQGVVYETLNLSRVRGYASGGAFHVVINNQIGFTTNPEESRSSTYCSDGAKAFHAPVFHVNCEDIEAVCWVTKLALEFRLRYERDVFVDLYCWRKYGHNEGDDPSFTQPISYLEIKSKKSAARTFADKLMSEGVIDTAGVEALYTSYKDKFNAAQERKVPKVRGEACAIHGRLQMQTADTGVQLNILEKVSNSLISYPHGFTIHPKLKQILEKRVATLKEGEGIDWGFAEALAYGSLVLEGRRIRLSGQDAGRGTFSHRHLALNNYERPEIYYPLTALSSNSGAGSFEVHNSTLSEAGVLGFEYGYSLEAPNALVLWEGQFGDFANGAQVHIDQFIVSAEAKWHQLSGVVLLLPHGYEGQGPEHSSARLERFLQLCAEGNIVVANPTNAAQHFHLLRRQGLSELKRPLVVMTPKSLLRLPDATSKTEDFIQGRFKNVIAEDFNAKGEKKHLVLLSGKIYYDLLKEIKAKNISSLRLIRVEQLYPFPAAELKKIISSKEIKSLSWIQEEPKNMGAWTFIKPYLEETFGQEAKYYGRPDSASPATGSSKRHSFEQQSLISDLLKTLA